METHKFDIISFIFGAVFMAGTASVLLDLNFDPGFDVGPWILPVAFFVVGVALLTSAIRATLSKNGSGPS